MDVSIIVALITSVVALFTSLITAINARRALSVQKEVVLIPMQKELFSINIRQLQKIKNEVKKEKRKKVEGIESANNNDEAKDNIAEIIARGVHSLTDLLPDLIEEAYLITQRKDLRKLEEVIENVKKYKGLLQAKHLYGATNDDDKLKEYEKNFNPIDAIFKVSDEFEEILNQEILRFNTQLQEIIGNA